MDKRQLSFVGIVVTVFATFAIGGAPIDDNGPPIPLELLAFGLASTLNRLTTVQRRDVPLSPDGGVIADYHGPVDDPAALAVRLSGTPGVVQHGLFPPEMVSTVLVGRGESVDRTDFEHSWSSS